MHQSIVITCALAKAIRVRTRHYNHEILLEARNQRLEGQFEVTSEQATVVFPKLAGPQWPSTIGVTKQPVVSWQRCPTSVCAGLPAAVSSRLMARLFSLNYDGSVRRARSEYSARTISRWSERTSIALCECNMHRTRACCGPLCPAIALLSPVDAANECTVTGTASI